jgi:hypothetical protein
VSPLEMMETMEMMRHKFHRFHHFHRMRRIKSKGDSETQGRFYDNSRGITPPAVFLPSKTE